jgi:hypothetical protein
MPEQRDPDEIDRRLRELTEDIGTQRIHEPSAREREEAAKRAAKRARKRHPGRTLSILVAIVIIVGGGAFAYFAKVKTHHAPQATTTTRPTARPVLAAPAVSGPPADPFAGSPAAGWADGAAGLTVPAAGPHGPYTATQVHAAYESTKTLLVAQDLDWPTLGGGNPAAFENLLPSWYRSQFTAALDKTGRNKDGTLRTTRAYVTSFAPGTTQFVTHVVKVHGYMSAGTATDSGTKVLRVQFDYLFTYAIEPPGRPADWMRIVQQQYGYFDFSESSMTTFYTFDLSSFTAGGLCDVTDGYVHPAFPQAPTSTVQPSGPARQPYSLATPSTGTGPSCVPTTGRT